MSTGPVPGVIACRWPAPAGISAWTTTRIGGVSRPPFDGFNQADHVGDRPAAVAANRRALAELLQLPAEPRWLSQVHGTTVVTADGVRGRPDADGSFTRTPGVVCAVLTADCLPILLCDAGGNQVAALHAGWRGLAAGVIEAGLATFAEPSMVHAWIGPAIGRDAFEIGADAHDRLRDHPSATATAFIATGAGHWKADLGLLARRRLERGGVRTVSGGTWCTYSDADRFFSYRRDHVTGRTASLIWLD